MLPDAYPWTRYCAVHPPGGDSFGWTFPNTLLKLLAPENLQAHAAASVFVLLGEAGEGKTFELSRFAPAGAIMRLEAYSDERSLRDDLRAALREGSQAASADPGVLVLDSLDETTLNIKTALEVIFSELERLGDKINRIRLRIGCRTGAWPGFATARLQKLLEGKGEVVVRHLLPLTRDDALRAADRFGISGTEFVRAIERHGLVPLACRPATLLMLLQRYRSGELPESRWQLYEATTLAAVEESPERDFRGTVLLSAPEHRAIAARLAVAVLLGNYNGVSQVAGYVAEGLLDPSALIGEDLHPLGGVLRVELHGILEVIRGPMFTGDGGNRRFLHRSIGEYLAAWRLSQAHIDGATLIDLLCAGDAFVRPQLQEVAGWIAARRPDLWLWLLEHQPAVLLLGDTSSSTNKGRNRLVEAILSACEDRRLADRVGGWDEHFERLDHPALPDQLSRWIAKERDFVCRRVAFRMAIDCAWWRMTRPDPPEAERRRWGPFVSRAVAVALDPADSYEARSYAAAAIEAIGDRDAILQLGSLLSLPREHDADCEIRGSVLRALWRRKLIAADELFAHLDDPPRSNLFGMYRLFLEQDLVPGLAVDELPYALAWVKDGNSPEPYTDRGVRRQIMERAWQAADNESVFEALVDTVAALLAGHDGVALDAALIAAQPALRRRVAFAVLTRTGEAHELFELRRWGLTQSDDLPWLIGLHRDAHDPSLRERFRWAIRTVLDLDNPSHGPAILDACSESEDLENYLRLLAPVSLDDPYVQRERARRKGEEEQRRKVRPKAIEAVREALTNRSGDAWWRLWHSLALDDAEATPEPFRKPLTELPGWVAADRELRSQVQAVALRYLRSRDPETHEWLGTNKLSGTMLAGVAAFECIAGEPGVLNSLTDAAWERWLPTLMVCSHRTPDSVRLIATSRFGTSIESVARRLVGAADPSEAKYNVNTLRSWWCPNLQPLVRDWLAAPRDEDLDHELLKLASESAPELLSEISWARLRDGTGSMQYRANAAAALFRYADEPKAEWWEIVRADEALADATLGLIATERFLRGGQLELSSIPGEILSGLYRWLALHYPPEDDPGFGAGARALGRRDAMGEFRDRLIQALSLRATDADVSCLSDLEAEYPERLRWALAEAKTRNREHGWSGWPVAKLLAKLSGEPSRMPMAHPVDEVRQTMDLDAIFPQRGFPQHTYVAMPQHARLQSLLRARALPVLVDGPAAAGKTTAVRFALDDLGVPREQRQVFACADTDDRRRLRAALDRGFRTLQGYVIVDDVHRIVDSSLLEDLIGAVKSIPDYGGPCCVLVTTTVGARSLFARFPDALASVRRISIAASEETLHQIVKRGALHLGVEVRNELELVRLACGSAQILQMACNGWFRQHLTNRGTVPAYLTFEPEGVVSWLLDEFVSSDPSIERFVRGAGDNPDARSAAIALLWAAGRSGSGVVAADQLPAAITEHRESIRRAIDRGSSPDLPFHTSNGEFHVEDLRVLFVLRHSSPQAWSSLASRVSASIIFRPAGTPHWDAKTDWARQRDRLLHCLRCSEFHKNVYLLGSTEQRVTFYAQQCRALSFVHALSDKGELGPGKTMAIVGGGLSGLTAAVAAARRGCEVMVYEAQSAVLSRQAVASHRWVHPHIYDSITPPASAHSNLPVLPWSAGYASDVVAELRLAWAKELTALTPRLRVRLNAPVAGLEVANDGRIRVREEGVHRKAYDIVLLAVGFGPEKVKADGRCVADAQDYWHPDALVAENLAGRILVSGSGDGGMVDLARALIVGFRHDLAVKWITESDPLEPLRLFIRDRESSIGEELLPEAYEDIISRIGDVRQVFQTMPEPMRLRRGVSVTFVYRDTPYRPKETSGVNRALTALLLALTDDAGQPMVRQISFGIDAVFNDGTYTLRGSRERFDHALIRHGPDPSFVARLFPQLETSVRRMQGDIRVLDLTRELHEETLAFFVHPQ